MKFYSFEALWFGLLSRHVSDSAYRYVRKPKGIMHDNTTGFIFCDFTGEHLKFKNLDQIKSLIPEGKIINIGGLDYITRWTCVDLLFGPPNFEALGFDIL